jgi:hypothetical protein
VIGTQNSDSTCGGIIKNRGRGEVKKTFTNRIDELIKKDEITKLR